MTVELKAPLILNLTPNKCSRLPIRQGLETAARVVAFEGPSLPLCLKFNHQSNPFPRNALLNASTSEEVVF